MFEKINTDNKTWKGEKIAFETISGKELFVQYGVSDFGINFALYYNSIHFSCFGG
jgi:hypothetical protein